MNTSIKTAFAAIALSLTIAGPAAANLSGQSLQGEINSAVTSGNVHVRVDDGVATLFGWVEDGQMEQAAKQAALSFEGVDQVVDLITVSN